MTALTESVPGTISAATDFWGTFDAVDGPQLPDPITFTIGEQWLGRPNLYPRQSTLLKIIFLRDDLFTDYDHQVIAEWIAEFHATNPNAGPENKFEAKTNGIQPDIYERIAWLKARGYRWFKEVLMAVGRRGSKGYVCSLAMAYVLWAYLCRGDPQEFYGIDRDKQLAVMIFAGKKEQAKQNLWGDLYNAITGSSCFAPYISEAQAESVTVFAPHDEQRIAKLIEKGIRSTKDMASFGVFPKESTLLSGRGPAACILGFDEAAHVKNAGTSRQFGDVYGAAGPALDQFGKDAFIVIPSSTWEMTGKFYELWQNSLEREEDEAGEFVGIYPNKLMLQLASWDPYKDWEIAQDLELFPAGFVGDLGEYQLVPLPRMAPMKGAIQIYDDDMAREERANPDTFGVERRSWWATSLDAYLNPGKVDEMFAPWGLAGELRPRPAGDGDPRPADHAVPGARRPGQRQLPVRLRDGAHRARPGQDAARRLRPDPFLGPGRLRRSLRRLRRDHRVDLRPRDHQVPPRGADLRPVQCPLDGPGAPAEDLRRAPAQAGAGLRAGRDRPAELEDVRDLQGRAEHGLRARPGARRGQR